MAGVTCAAMTAESVISALASRPGMSSQPLGGGSRPTCEVLIRVMLRCIFLSFPVPACVLGGDHGRENGSGQVVALTEHQLFASTPGRLP